jgi:hypothetical protein
MSVSRHAGPSPALPSSLSLRLDPLPDARPENYAGPVPEHLRPGKRAPGMSTGVEDADPRRPGPRPKPPEELEHFVAPTPRPSHVTKMAKRAPTRGNSLPDSKRQEVEALLLAGTPIKRAARMAGVSPGTARSCARRLGVRSAPVGFVGTTDPQNAGPVPFVLTTDPQTTPAVPVVPQEPPKEEGPSSRARSARHASETRWARERAQKAERVLELLREGKGYREVAQLAKCGRAMVRRCAAGQAFTCPCGRDSRHQGSCSHREKARKRALCREGYYQALKDIGFEDVAMAKCRCGHLEFEHFGDGYRCARKDCTCAEFTIPALWDERTRAARGGRP